MRFGLYVHLPFCRRKCPYCDFVSFAGVKRGTMVAYAAALAREVSLWAAELGATAAQARGRLRSLYIGGGTPTLWPLSCWQELFSAIRRHFVWPDGLEATVEANPESVDGTLLAALRAAGVNRLSLGVQSFREDLLAAAGRGHRAADVARAVGLARAAGFDNLNLDLIYGLPGQDLAAWRADLAAALALAPTHLSLYELHLEPTTPWGRAKEEGRLALPPEEERAAMYTYACRRLRRAGFVHYEISNFAHPGYACRHNLGYWKRRPYLGLGVAASSFMAKRRWTNTSSLAAYLAATRAGRLPVAESEEIDKKTAMAETMFLGLRLRRGVSLAAFARTFGRSATAVYGEEIAALKRQGLLEERAGYLRLTNRGLLLGNVAFRAFV